VTEEDVMTAEAYRFPARLGGNLCLDFTNTVEFRDSERQIEFLHSYDHVAAWCGFALEAQRGDRAKAELKADYGNSSRAELKAERAHQFQRAIDLRDAIYHIFTAIIANSQPSEADLATLNAALDGAKRRIELRENGFVWAWSQADMLAPIAWAAADLLTSDDLDRVRQCPNCGWLFVDTSRNHSRRWCSMDYCGSQAKSRRQYQRRKSAQS
jgi:predicted RNA-binding Zn ribbon-like protein